MLIPRYTHAHRYLKITILCTSTCVYTHRYKNYTIYLHICKHILTYGRAGTVAGIPPITTSAGACTPCSRTLTPPAARLHLQAAAASFRKDLLKHREQKWGHTEYEGNAGALLTAAVSLRQEAITAAQSVSPRSQVSLSRLQLSPPSTRVPQTRHTPEPPQTLPQPRCWDSTGLPAAALAHADAPPGAGQVGCGSGAGGRHARVQTPRGRRNGPYREAREPTRPRTGAPAQPARKQGAYRPPLTPHRQQ